MDNSSWIQKSSPNRCPVCGIAVRVKPYLAGGELLCPRCGTRLWFFVLRGETHFLLPVRNRFARFG
jgi:DNA-directed RNA polymerase subunit RPC12/RpoP